MGACTYNGIAMTNCLTDTHVIGPGFDDSNSDQLYSVISLKVRSTINPRLLPGDITAGANAAEVLKRIRHKLTLPRAPLYYDLDSVPGQTGNSPLIDLPGGRDDANGPLPDPDAITVVYTTPQTIEITWACVVRLRLCGDDFTNLPLSIRWEDSFEMDELFRAKYTRTGTVIVSSRSTFDLDTFRRNKIAPKVLHGFARKGSRYAISRDGLRCDFEFVDMQIRWAPPYPAAKMSIVQSETLPLLGQMRKGFVDVTLIGMINADPVALKDWAATVGWFRMLAAGPLSSQGKVVGEGVFTTDESEESISVNFRLEYKVTPESVDIDPILATQKQALEQWAAAFEANGIGADKLGVLLGKEGVTTQGNQVPSTPVLPWVGAGTSASGGYQSWANPTGEVDVPADGVGLATSVKLFAALLNDPCGQALKTTPDAVPGVTEIRTNVATYNTEVGGGKGGETAVSNSYLIAGLSTLASSAYSTLATRQNLFCPQASLQAGVYDLWQCLDEYVSEPGALVVPSCNPVGYNSVVSYSSRMYTLRRRWTASRTGNPPQTPPQYVLNSAGNVDTNWWPTKGYISSRELRVAPDGVSITYEVSGIYEFQILNPNLFRMQSQVPPFLCGTVREIANSWMNPPQVSQLSNSPPPPPPPPPASPPPVVSPPPPPPPPSTSTLPNLYFGIPGINGALPTFIQGVGTGTVSSDPLGGGGGGGSSPVGDPVGIPPP